MPFLWQAIAFALRYGYTRRLQTHLYLLLPCQPVPRGHGVTEGDLPLAHGHAVGGQQVAENMLRLPVRPLVTRFRGSSFASFPVDDKLIRRSFRCAARIWHQRYG